MKKQERRGPTLGRLLETANLVDEVLLDLAFRLERLPDRDGVRQG